MSLVAVTSRLALVGAELPVVKFVDPDQMVYDIIERKVYRRDKQTHILTSSQT